MTFINSTYDMSLLKGNNFQFIGLENYLRIFEDQKLLSSIGFTVKFTVVSMFFHLVLGVILALMLNMKIKGKIPAYNSTYTMGNAHGSSGTCCKMGV